MEVKEFMHILWVWQMKNERPRLDYGDLDVICEDLEWNLTEDRILDYLEENY